MSTMHVEKIRPFFPSRPTIGVLLENTHGYWFSVWRHIAERARKRELNLLTFVGQALESPVGLLAEENRVYELLDTKKLDGLLVLSGLGNFVSEQVFEVFCRTYSRSLPMVSLFTPLKTCPSVLFDNTSGWRQALRHLIVDHGYRRIAFIKGPAAGYDAKSRYHAYAETLVEYGLEIDPALILSGDYSLESGRTAVKRLCESNTHVDAIASSNDFMAFGALQALREEGVRVPQDLALIGFDDLYNSQYEFPPLTTVRQPIAEAGRQGLELLLAQMSAEDVPQNLILPAELVIRQSCGCPSKQVIQAGIDNISSQLCTTGASFDLPGTEQRAQILEELTQILFSGEEEAEEDAEISNITRLLDALLRELHDGRAGDFLPLWHESVTRWVMDDKDVTLWQEIASRLRCQILPFIRGTKTLIQAGNLWQKIRVLSEEISKQVYMLEEEKKGQQAQRLRELSETLLSTFDVQSLMTALAKELPQIGVSLALIAQYECPSNADSFKVLPDRSRLLLAVHHGERCDDESMELWFHSRDLVPEGIPALTEHYEMFVMPLYFLKRQLGFALFGAGLQDGVLYATLQRQISSTLQGALLVQQVRERSAEVSRQKYILDTFMANVPDPIYFKDPQGRFLRTNMAHASAFGFQSPETLYGKTDFDLFSEMEAHRKFEQEQEIIRTGEALHCEEHDEGKWWRLTTKMPLKNEYGDIIGTFGISRNISELKNAQQKLELANAEIQRMNEELKEENLQMGAELEVARRIQQILLPPPQELQSIEGFDIAGYMRPADEVGGDYYDVILHHGSLHAGIGDVTGHGLESGIITIMTQTAIRTLIERGERDPVKFVNTLNRTIFQNIQRMGIAKSLTFVLITCEGGTLKLAGQHEKILLLRNNGLIEQVDTAALGFPLGLVEDISTWVTEAAISLEPGEGVVLYTDGIPEAQNEQGEFYGLDRLCTRLAQCRNQAAEHIKQAVIDDLVNFIGEQKMHDDVTLVVLKQEAGEPHTEL